MIQFLPLLMQALGSGAGGAVASQAAPMIGGQLFDAIKAGGGQGYGAMQGPPGGYVNGPGPGTRTPPGSPPGMPEPPAGPGGLGKSGTGAGHKKAGTLGAEGPEGYKDMSMISNPNQIMGMLGQMLSQQQQAQKSTDYQPFMSTQESPYIEQLMRML